MRTIAKGKEPIASLWSASPVRTDTYRLIRYHVRTECDEGTLLLNTVTGELVLLSIEEVRLLECFPKAYEPAMDELITHRFLVPEAFDELKSMLQLRKVLRSLSYPENNVAGYTILPTTTCNARCFYCYESEYPRCSMSDKTVEQLVDYIESHCGEAKKVRINWFGGEPTLGEKRIDYICESLEARGISFTSSMISNGYLFTREMAHKAKEKWRLRNIQITLDGTEAIYNSVKSYVNPEGSPYQRVIDNIGFLLDEKIRVSIRMNLDRHNADNLRELIDEMAERFPRDNHFSMYVHEIFEGMGFEPIRRSEDELREIIEIKQAVESYIDGKGVIRSARATVRELPFLKAAYCMADNPTSVLVNPRGGFGKCQHIQYEHLVGGLQDVGATDSEELLYWLNYQPRKGCDRCPMSPWCGVPQTCASGRTCIPLEVDNKIEAVRELCRRTTVNNSSLREA